MPIFQDKNKLIIILLLTITAVIIVSLLISKYGLLGKKNPPIPKQVQIKLPKSSTKPSSLQQGPYQCPAILSFCQSGQDVYKNGQYLGFGGKIATGSAVLAAFEGNLSIISNTLPPQFNSEKLTTIYLDNKDKGLRGIYYFKGQAVSLTTVKAGEKIGTITGPMAYYDQNFLIFALIKNDFIKGQPTKLTAKDFIP